MQNTGEIKSLLKTLEKIQQIYSDKATSADIPEVQKAKYANLADGIQLLRDVNSGTLPKENMKSDSNIELAKKTIDAMNASSAKFGDNYLTAFCMTSNIRLGLYDEKKLKYLPDLSSFVGSLTGLATPKLQPGSISEKEGSKVSDILSCDPAFLAEILHIGSVNQSLSQSGIPSKSEELKSFLNTANELNPSYLTPHMQSILSTEATSVVVDLNSDKISINRQDITSREWESIFLSTEEPGDVRTKCAQVEVALKYAGDPNVRTFIQESLDSMSESVGSLKTKDKFTKGPEILTRHITEVIGNFEETQKECTPEKIQEQAISQVSKLLSNPNLSERDIDQIAFKVYKQLKTENKLGGIDSLNLDESTDDKNKKFNSVLDKVKARANSSKESSMPDLGIMDFLSTVYYAIVDLFKNKEQVKTKTVLGKYTKSIIEAKANNHPALAA